MGPVPSPTVSSGRGSGLALFGLLAVAVTWGSSFPITKVILEDLTSAQFLAVRFLIAAVVMTAVCRRAIRALSRPAVLRGIGLGALYGVAQLIQTIGLETTPAAISAFITGLYVVLTPICAAVLVRTRIPGRVWAGAVLATFGLAVLALNDFSFGFGEIVTLISAVLYSLHIVGLGQWTTPDQALGLSAVQIASCAVVSVVAAAPGGYALPSTAGIWSAPGAMPSWRSRADALYRRWTARLAPEEAGPVAAPPVTDLDDPASALRTFAAAYPAAAATLLHPADAQFFLEVCDRPGKPVPFVPVLDAEVRRWYMADGLWQAQDEGSPPTPSSSSPAPRPSRASPAPTSRSPSCSPASRPPRSGA